MDINARHREARPDDPGAPSLFRVEKLCLTTLSPNPYVLVDDVSFELARGESLAVIGESGCGKSLTCWSCVGLPPKGVQITATEIAFSGKRLFGPSGLNAAAFTRVRGKRIAMIFQDPVAALNPRRRVGSFLVSLLRKHMNLNRAEAQSEAIRLLEAVGIPKARERMTAYPHELSGGQCQRVMIAGALAGDPDMIIADEPTTALDVTTQAQIMSLLDKLRRDRGLGVLLVTHDLGVVAECSDRVMVMYAGRVVETGPVDAVLSAPRHPYTLGLIRSLPPEHGKAALTPIQGTVPALSDRPSGCAFASRCPRALTEICHNEVPPLRRTGVRDVACWNENDGGLYVS
jgi:peptide/nickel transport system ATP-binding protein